MVSMAAMRPLPSCIDTMTLPRLLAPSTNAVGVAEHEVTDAQLAELDEEDGVEHGAVQVGARPLVGRCLVGQRGNR